MMKWKKPWNELLPIAQIAIDLLLKRPKLTLLLMYSSNMASLLPMPDLRRLLRILGADSSLKSDLRRLLSSSVLRLLNSSLALPLSMAALPDCSAESRDSKSEPVHSIENCDGKLEDVMNYKAANYRGHLREITHKSIDMQFL